MYITDHSQGKGRPQFGERHTGRTSTFQPMDLAKSRHVVLVTLFRIERLLGTTTVKESPVFFNPMNPEVLNSSISELVRLSRCKVM